MIILPVGDLTEYLFTHITSSICVTHGQAAHSEVLMLRLLSQGACHAWRVLKSGFILSSSLVCVSFRLGLLVLSCCCKAPALCWKSTSLSCNVSFCSSCLPEPICSHCIYSPMSVHLFLSLHHPSLCLCSCFLNLDFDAYYLQGLFSPLLHSSASISWTFVMIHTVIFSAVNSKIKEALCAWEHIFWCPHKPLFKAARPENECPSVEPFRFSGFLWHHRTTAE